MGKSTLCQIMQIVLVKVNFSLHYDHYTHYSSYAINSLISIFSNLVTCKSGLTVAKSDRKC